MPPQLPSSESVELELTEAVGNNVQVHEENAAPTEEGISSPKGATPEEGKKKAFPAKPTTVNTEKADDRVSPEDTANCLSKWFLLYLTPHHELACGLTVKILIPLHRKLNATPF